MCVSISDSMFLSVSVSLSLLLPPALCLSPPPPFPSLSQARAEVFSQAAAQGPRGPVVPSPNGCGWQDQTKSRERPGFSGALAPEWKGRAFQSLVSPRSVWKRDLSDRWGQRDPRLLHSAPGEERGRGTLQHLVTEDFEPRLAAPMPSPPSASCPPQPLPAVLPLQPLGSNLGPILTPPPPRCVTLGKSLSPSNLSFFVWRMEVIRSEL